MRAWRTGRRFRATTLRKLPTQGRKIFAFAIAAPNDRAGLILGGKRRGFRRARRKSRCCRRSIAMGKGEVPRAAATTPPCSATQALKARTHNRSVRPDIRKIRELTATGGKIKLCIGSKSLHTFDRRARVRISKLCGHFDGAVTTLEGVDVPKALLFLKDCRSRARSIVDIGHRAAERDFGSESAVFRSHKVPSLYDEFWRSLMHSAAARLPTAVKEQPQPVQQRQRRQNRLDRHRGEIETGHASIRHDRGPLAVPAP